jgi:hypothetical protein
MVGSLNFKNSSVEHIARISSQCEALFRDIFDTTFLHEVPFLLTPMQAQCRRGSAMLQTAERSHVGRGGSATWDIVGFRKKRFIEWIRRERSSGSENDGGSCRLVQRSVLYWR